MKTGGKHRRRGRLAGLTLLETALALAVLAATIPVLLGAMVAATEARRHAEHDTRAAWIAHRVNEELRLAWSGRESLFGDKVPAYPCFGGEQAEVALVFDVNGDYLRRPTDGEVESGIRDRGAGYVALVEGTAYRPAGVTMAEPMSKVRVAVEAPAQAPRAKRLRHAFTGLQTREVVP